MSLPTTNGHFNPHRNPTFEKLTPLCSRSFVSSIEFQSRNSNPMLNTASISKYLLKFCCGSQKLSTCTSHTQTSINIHRKFTLKINWLARGEKNLKPIQKHSLRIYAIINNWNQCWLKPGYRAELKLNSNLNMIPRLGGHSWVQLANHTKGCMSRYPIFQSSVEFSNLQGNTGIEFITGVMDSTITPTQHKPFDHLLYCFEILS